MDLEIAKIQAAADEGKVEVLEAALDKSMGYSRAPDSPPRQH